MKTLLIFILSILLLASCSSVAAKGKGPRFRGGMMHFGKQDTLHWVQELDFLGPNDEDLDLAYRTTTTSFILGVNLTKNGYVLEIRDSDPQQYISLTEELKQKLQDEGDLPDPLPDYYISKTHYMFGYSLWIVIYLFILYGLIKSEFKSRR